ncbi:MAG: 2-(1,2-epoxy-1,2-dihydrophenyl)acetyl-CoA isomerase [Promethearchaeota archaeon]|nr:MAG: 2-(1,2-epoxy-1,2-dihydrophenyl)acetyl-CoA isomerase [Candidatus Lokiarchaeota archaeon]
MSPNYETVLYDKKDKVAIITLNRPEKMNAINLQMNKDLKLALNEAKNDNGVRAIVITGAGKAFCAGGDVAEFANGEFSSGSNGEAEKLLIHPYDLYKLYKPIIAAVNGVAVGFGTNLTLCCDITFASERASFGEFFIRMGIIPDMNGSLTLPLTIGIHKAKELIFSGERIYAEEALQIGLVNRVYLHDELMPKTMEFANNLAEKAPLAISLSKQAIHKAYETVFKDMLAIETEYNTKLYASEDHKEAATAWVERRKPLFKGR